MTPTQEKELWRDARWNLLGLAKLLRDNEQPQTAAEVDMAVHLADRAMAMFELADASRCNKPSWELAKFQVPTLEVIITQLVGSG